MKELTITELSKELDVSHQSISKLKKDGVFDDCFTDDKKKIT